MKKRDFTPKWMFLMILSPLIFSAIYFFIAVHFNLSKMSYFQFFQMTALIGIVVPGGYQIYFWTQRNSNFFKTIILKTKIDDLFPFWPKWIWLYSFLYYFLIGGIVIVIQNIEQGVYFIFGGLVLLIIQCICFILFPAINPPEWREYEANTISKKYLKFVQSFDGNNNCFPSIHVSLATYISMLLFPTMGLYCLIFPGLIGISCLFTKQHQFVDVVAGFILGLFVFWLI